jgi:hypothetical protein
MTQDALKDLLFGGIRELSKNRVYFYQSSIGSEYSHWTEAGLKALGDFTKMLTHMATEAEEEQLNKRAKDLVLKGLKGEEV